MHGNLLVLPGQVSQVCKCDMTCMALNKANVITIAIKYVLCYKKNLLGTFD